MKICIDSTFDQSRVSQTSEQPLTSIALKQILVSPMRLKLQRHPPILLELFNQILPLLMSPTLEDQVRVACMADLCAYVILLYICISFMRQCVMVPCWCARVFCSIFHHIYLCVPFTGLSSLQTRTSSVGQGY